MQAIDSRAPTFADPHQAGVFEHAEMARDSRPSARKSLCDLTCRHRSASEMENHQDLASSRVSQRGE